MNRSELVTALAHELDITLTDASSFIKTFEKIIQTTLSEGSEISLIGLGRFYRKRHGARLGRHPLTGEEISLPAIYVPAFSPSKALKESISQSG